MRGMRVLMVMFAVAMVAAMAAGTARAESPLEAASKLPAKKAVAVFGQKIAYYDTGSGPAVVLVHGFGSEARLDWGRVIVPLAAKHRVIALDEIGFGASDKPFVDYSVQTFVDFLGEFLRTLGVKDFTLMGESLGGWISALYTIEALGPANHGVNALPPPKKLVLEDAAGMASIKEALRRIPIAGTLEDAKSIAFVFHDKSLVTDEFARENFAMRLKANDGWTERLFGQSPKLDDELVAGRLGAITIPTLVVWGGDDQIVPLEQGRAYAAGIPGAKLAIVPDCGHAASIEKPKEFLAAVSPFVD